MSGRTPGAGPSHPGDAPAWGPHPGAGGDIGLQAPLPRCPAPLGKNWSNKYQQKKESVMMSFVFLDYCICIQIAALTLS